MNTGWTSLHAKTKENNHNVLSLFSIGVAQIWSNREYEEVEKSCVQAQKREKGSVQVTRFAVLLYHQLSSFHMSDNREKDN